MEDIKSIMAEKVKATPLHKANLATQLSAKKAKRAASAGERLRDKKEHLQRRAFPFEMTDEHCDIVQSTSAVHPLVRQHFHLR